MNGLGWRMLTQTTNNVLERFRLNFLRYANRDMAVLTPQPVCMVCAAPFSPKMDAYN